MKLGEDLKPRRDGQAARRAGQAAGRDRGRQRLGARPHARDRDGRAAAAAARRRRRPSCRAASGAASRSAALLLEQPDMLLLDEPTNHLDAETVAWLEHHLHEYPGTVVAVTHDRYFLDNVAGWILELDRGAGIPWEGNYSSWLEQKQQAPAQRGEGGVGAAAHARARARVGARVAARAPGQEQGAPRGLRGAAGRGDAEARGRRSRSASRRARGSATWWSKAEQARARATATTLLIEDLTFNLPRGGIVGVIGAERRRQDDAVPHDHRPGEARRRHAAHRRHRQARLRRPEPRRARRRQDRRSRRSRRARSMLEIGKRKITSRAYVAGFNFKGTDQQKRVKDLSGGERNRVHLAKLLRTRRQPAAARRADQRPRRRHAARARGRAARRSPAASSSSATTAGSSTASPPTSSPSRATARWSGSRATTRTTRPTGSGAWARTPTSRTASATRSSYIETMTAGASRG